MNKSLLHFLCGILAVITISSCSTSQNINSTTVEELHLNRYLGKWYEIARFDHTFERGLVGCTANYSLKDDGTIKVINAGYKNNLDGKYQETEGKARRPNDTDPANWKLPSSETSMLTIMYSNWLTITDMP